MARNISELYVNELGFDFRQSVTEIETPSNVSPKR